MMPGTWRRVLPTLSIVLGVGVSGCGDDPLSANESLANHFQRLADDLGPDQVSRQRALMVASRALRLGSAISEIGISENGSTAVFSAVAVQWGFVRDDSVNVLGTEVVAWRGRDAQRLVHLYTPDSILVIPHPRPPPGEDSVVYIENRPPPLTFLKGTRTPWWKHRCQRHARRYEESVIWRYAASTSRASPRCSAVRADECSPTSALHPSRRSTID